MCVKQKGHVYKLKCIFCTNIIIFKLLFLKMNVAQTIKTYNENSDLSIRCLNYFVVNYAKAEHVVLGQKKNLYHEYQAKLKRSKRINFDPFNRGQKCVFHGVHTSKAQIEFFTWALAFNVLEYFQNHC